ncbi:CMD domain-containing protein [Agrobacterium larrymoorei]|uniref:CMD domain protein n=1 Tax=Agrobacterium larrymoorei TaxID=160699 RepID=A0AAF0HFB1_9HYPH|nr:CMD domain protein [Agrobacterium larrymoorei]WHA43760.1 CMD domain protein [Agrobacterium larrymoorei]
MTDTFTGDVIDNVLGLKPSDELFRLREQRAKMKHLTQTSYNAALRPAEPRNFSYALRAAIAARMSALWKADELQAHYLTALKSENASDDVVEIANPASATPGDVKLTTILAHVDLVTLSPKEATRANIDKLYAAGLDDRDIVTLAGLIAYVNYQILVVAGLKMMRDN